MPLRSRVQEVHSACGALSLDPKARDLIAYFQRQLEGSYRFSFSGFYRERRFSERFAACSQGTDRS
jgi:hypothetical protein